MTTQTQSKEQLIWEGLLNGSISPEDGLAALTTLRGANIAQLLLNSAMEQRKAGLASGAAWAQTPLPGAVLGPIQPGPKYDASGNLIANQGPLPEESNPFGAYQRGLGQAGKNVGIGGGEFGDYLRGRFAPTNAVYLGQRALRGNLAPGEVEDPNDFANYAQQTQGGGQGFAAQGIFQGLMNRLRGGDVSKLAAGDPTRAFLTPSGDADYGLGASLAQEAARGRLGGYAASRLLPSNSELISQFRAGPTGAQNTDFLAYLQRALGL